MISFYQFTKVVNNLIFVKKKVPLPSVEGDKKRIAPHENNFYHI